MLTIKDLSRINRTLSCETLESQLGPFVLIQQPPPDQARKVGLQGIEVTDVRSARAISQNALALLFQFDNLCVATLPPFKGNEALTIGRLPDCDVVVDDPSVSKRHAVLRWDAEKKVSSLKDLDSTNGTFLNASVRLSSELELRDGDIVSFGDVQFWYLLTRTLHSKLSTFSFVGPSSG